MYWDESLSIYLVSLEESSDLSVFLLLHHVAVIRLLGVSYLNVDIITLFICVIKTIRSLCVCFSSVKFSRKLEHYCDIDECTLSNSKICEVLYVCMQT